MNVAEWVLLGIGVTVLVLGVGRAIWVNGYRKGVERERARAMRMGAALRDLRRLDRETRKAVALTERFDDDEERAA